MHLRDLVQDRPVVAHPRLGLLADAVRDGRAVDAQEADVLLGRLRLGRVGERLVPRERRVEEDEARALVEQLLERLLALRVPQLVLLVVREPRLEVLRHDVEDLVDVLLSVNMSLTTCWFCDMSW